MNTVLEIFIQLDSSRPWQPWKTSEPESTDKATDSFMGKHPDQIPRGAGFLESPTHCRTLKCRWFKELFGVIHVSLNKTGWLFVYEESFLIRSHFFRKLCTLWYITWISDWGSRRNLEHGKILNESQRVISVHKWSLFTIGAGGLKFPIRYRPLKEVALEQATYNSDLVMLGVIWTTTVSKLIPCDLWIVMAWARVNGNFAIYM